MNNDDKRRRFLCGVCEGFYGRPWTMEQRKTLFERMNRMHMTDYMYAPKDDIKHRAAWRKKYTDAECECLRALIDAAKVNDVTFIYALSPGIDIIYSSSQELSALNDKFDQVRQLGCDAFALLFDDIETRMCEADKRKFGTFASAQVHVTNTVFLHQQEQSPLIHFLFCPTEYCESRAVPTLEKSPYLNTVGQKLLPGIQVFWTGPRVISRILSRRHCERVAKVLQRPPLIWDNLHANDYDPRRVFLGPYAGRPIEAREFMAGVLTNPNCEFESNFVAFHTLSAWSHAKYDISDNCQSTPEIYKPSTALHRALGDWLSTIEDEMIPKVKRKVKAKSAKRAVVQRALSLTQDGITINSTNSILNQLSSDTAGPLPMYTPQNMLSTIIDPTQPPPLVQQAQMCKSDDEKMSNNTDTNLVINENQGFNSLVPEFTSACTSTEPTTANEPMDTAPINAQSLNAMSLGGQVPVQITRDELAATNDDEDCSDSSSQSSGSYDLNLDDLLLLTHMFYMPFEHGPTARHLVEEMRWLRMHATVVSKARAMQAEAFAQDWYERAHSFLRHCAKVELAYHRLLYSGAAPIVMDLYAYFYELNIAVILLFAFVQWLNNGGFVSSADNINTIPSSVAPVSGRVSSDNADSTHTEQEPWVIRGGIISEIHNLLLHKCAALDMFVPSPIPIPGEAALSMRPFKFQDTRAIYELVLSSLDDGTSADVTRVGSSDLPGDRFIGAYLSYSPEHCFVLEEIPRREYIEALIDRANVEKIKIDMDIVPSARIVGVVCLAASAHEFHDYLINDYVVRMRDKYGEQICIDALNETQKTFNSPYVLAMRDLLAFFAEPQRDLLQSTELETYTSSMALVLPHDMYQSSAPKLLMSIAAATLYANGSNGLFTSIPAINNRQQSMLKQLGLVDLQPSSTLSASMESLTDADEDRAMVSPRTSLFAHYGRNL